MNVNNSNSAYSIGVGSIKEIGDLLIITAPPKVKNREIARYLYKLAPFFMLKDLKSGNADTIINNEFGESVRVNFSRIIR